MKIVFILSWVLVQNAWSGIGGSHGGVTTNRTELIRYINSKNFIVRSPQFYFLAGDSTVAIAGIELCIEQTDLRTIVPRDIFQDTHKNGIVSMGKEHLRLNLEEEKLKRDLAPEKDLKINVQIFKANAKTESMPVMDSSYVIPECED